MSDPEWTQIADAVSEAHALWRAGRAVSPSDELASWQAADGLFSALEPRLSVASRAGMSPSRDMIVRATSLLDVSADLLRLGATERTQALGNVYETLLNLLVALDSAAVSGARTAVPGPTTGRVGLQAEDLEPYEADARRDSRLMWVYYVAAGFLTAVTVAGIVWYSISRPPPTGDALVLPLSGLAVLLILALASGHQARECRRAVFETRRIHRQLLTLDKYLESMPELGRELLRGVMIQRLFPRLMDDDNPMREDDVFPDADKLLLALSPQLRNARRQTLKSRDAKTQSEGSSPDSSQESSEPERPPVGSGG